MTRPRGSTQLTKRYNTLANQLAAVEVRLAAVREGLVELPVLEHRAAEIAEALTHLGATIRMFNPTWEPKAPRARSPKTKRAPWEHGDLIDGAMKLLQADPETRMIGSEIVAAVAAKHGVTLTAHQGKAAQSSIVNTLAAYEKKGLVVGYDTYPRQWSIAVAPRMVARQRPVKPRDPTAPREQHAVGEGPHPARDDAASSP